MDDKKASIESMTDYAYTDFDQVVHYLGDLQRGLQDGEVDGLIIVATHKDGCVSRAQMMNNPYKLYMLVGKLHEQSFRALQYGLALQDEDGE